MTESATKSWKGAALRWGWVPVSALAVAALVHFIDLAQVWQAMRRADLANLGAMIGVWIVWLALRPVRMRVLLAASAPASPVSYDTAFGAHALGNALNGLLPMRAGEFAMLWVLKRRAHVPLAASFSAVVLDRLCDLASAVVLLALALYAMPDRPSSVSKGLEIVTGLTVAGVLVMAMAIRWRRRALEIARTLLPARLAKPALPRLERLLVGLGVLARPDVLLRVIVLSAMLWGLTVVSFRFGIAAIWPAADLRMASFALGVTAMAFLIPAAPGGIGIFHATNVFALSFFGVPTAVALAFAVLTHALTLATGVAIAAIWTAFNGIDPRQAVRAAEDASITEP